MSFLQICGVLFLVEAGVAVALVCVRIGFWIHFKFWGCD
jgi:hypothetical protein